MRPNPKSSKRRVLLVDDEPMLLRSVARHFELLGWDVVSCADGAQGREAARVGIFDAIVADLDLPSLTGTDLMNSLQDLQPTPRLVITSGHADILKKWHSTTPLPVAVLPKPFAMDELIRIIGDPL